MAQHPCQLDDEKLLRECRVETYRASGPGGQKRNKTDSAVRITHLASGVAATAADSRSQHDNRARALLRLRLQLALNVRYETEEGRPAWWSQAIDRAGRLHLGPKSELFVPTIRHLFDVLESCGGRVSEAAADLGVTTANLVNFMATDTHVWAAAQRLRQLHGHATMANPRK